MDEKELTLKLIEQKEQLRLLMFTYFGDKYLPISELIEKLRRIAQIENAFIRAIKKFEKEGNIEKDK